MTIVNMTQFFPWAWTLHLARALVAFNVAHAMMRDKYNWLVTFLSFVGCGFLYSFITIQWFADCNEYVMLALNMLLNFSLAFFVCKGNILYKLMTPILNYICQMVGTILYMKLSAPLLGTNAYYRLSAYEKTLTDILFNALAIFAFSFAFAFLLRLICQKTTASKTQNLRSMPFYLFPLTHCVGYILSFMPIQTLEHYGLTISETTTHYSAYETISMFYYAFCMLADLSIILITEHMNKQEERAVATEKQALQSTLNYRQMQMLREEKTAFRKIKHDMANLLTTAQGFIEIGKPEKAQELLKSTSLTVAEIDENHLCSNDTINTILYLKRQSAQTLGIRTDFHVTENGNVCMEEYDLCRLLHNALDHVLSEAALCSDSKTVSVQIDIESDKLCMTADYSVPPQKHRSAKESRTFGLSIIREILHKYGGTCTSDQNEGKQSLYITVPVQKEGGSK